MFRNFRFLITVTAFAALTVCGSVPASFAQETESQASQPPLYGGVNLRVRGVFVTPAAGSPFSATALIESKRPLPDGSTETQRTINIVARDAEGRIHNERRRLEPETFHGMPPLIETHIFDPQTRLNTFYDSATRVARQAILPELPKNPGIAASGVVRRQTNPYLKEEDLGTTTLDGLTAKGLRRTRTVSAQASGTGKPVEVVDEYWYSEELKVNLLVHHSDPRTGEQSIAISDVKREEPAEALFEVPAGFKTVDVTPPPITR